MKKNEIMLLLISVFVISVIWVGFSIYHNSITTTISEAISIRILPINPNFNTEIINNLKKRKKIGFFSPPVIILSPTPTISPFITPTSTASAIQITPKAP